MRGQGQLLVQIADKSDCTIRLMPRDQSQEADDIFDFAIDRTTIIQSSNKLATLMSTGGDSVYLKDISNQVLELILCVLHGDTRELLQLIEIDDLRELLGKIDEYGLDVKDFREWFTGWWSTNSREAVQKPTRMLYPAWEFDNAQAFRLLTKALAYGERGRIAEAKTNKFRHLHLPEHVIGCLSAAKGRLKTVLQRDLDTRMDNIFLRGTCPRQKDFVWAYLQALTLFKCRSIDTALNGHGPESPSSIDDILIRLEDFPSLPKDQGHFCFLCPDDWKNVVGLAISKTRMYFDGLCLDCMEMSKKDVGETQTRDYWEGWRKRGNWDEGCRIKHGEATWYHSWLGRPEDRQSNLRRRREFQKAMKREKEKESGVRKERYKASQAEHEIADRLNRQLSI